MSIKHKITKPKYLYTRLYTWWWKSGVGYKRAGELANRDMEAIRNGKTETKIEG